VSGLSNISHQIFPLSLIDCDMNDRSSEFPAVKKIGCSFQESGMIPNNSSSFSMHLLQVQCVQKDKHSIFYSIC
jgi:hypothetical protein